MNCCSISGHELVFNVYPIVGWRTFQYEELCPHSITGLIPVFDLLVLMWQLVEGVRRLEVNKRSSRGIPLMSDEKVAGRETVEGMFGHS